MIEAGLRWELHEDCVLMEPDVAPRLESCSATAGVGTEGVRLTLTAAGSSAPFEVFLSPETAKELSAFLSPAPAIRPAPGSSFGRTDSEER
jgi:hypothetical protein